jgi:recombination protein RecA
MAKKKKEESEKEAPSLFKKTIEMLNTEHGNQVIKSLTDRAKDRSIGLSSGSLVLDWAINAKLGGMPYGHVLEIYGPYSSGKTTIALGFCANATANKKQVIYADLERSLQSEMVLAAGIDEDYFSVVQCQDGRALAHDLVTLMKTGEVGVVVIDSLPQFKPLVEPKKAKKGKEEEEADPTKPKMAFAASFQSEAIPYLASIASDHNVILLVLNQIRKNLSSYGGGDIPYGGEVMKHQTSVRIKLAGKVTSKDDRILDSSGTLVGQNSRAEVNKNKTAVPMRGGSVPIFLGRGINPYLELAYYSQEVGIIEGIAGRFKWAGQDEQLAHGINNFSQVLYEDEDLYKTLRAKVIERMGIVYSPSVKVVNSFHDENFVKREVEIDTKSLAQRAEARVEQELEDE